MSILFFTKGIIMRGSEIRFTLTLCYMDNIMCVRYVCTLAAIYYSHRELVIMAITRVFQNGNSQALRIPTEMRTDKKEFIIRQVGEAYIAYPADNPWLPLQQVAGTFPADFMSDREQPSWDDATEREDL